MRKMKLLTLLMCLAMVFSCNTKQGTGASIGAGGGALIGGILGNIIGKNTKSTAIGAAIGGAIGAGTGAIIGRHMDKVAARQRHPFPDSQVRPQRELEEGTGKVCFGVEEPSGVLG